jgi:hypothetical protein
MLGLIRATQLAIGFQNAQVFDSGPAVMYPRTVSFHNPMAFLIRDDVKLIARYHSEGPFELGKEQAESVIGAALGRRDGCADICAEEVSKMGMLIVLQPE